MKDFISSIINYLKRKSSRHQLFVQYERKKFELPIYINELALYKYILERHSLTVAERDVLVEQHFLRCRKCLNGILELDNLINSLALTNQEEAHEYLDRYKEYSRLESTENKLLVFNLHEN